MTKTKQSRSTRYQLLTAPLGTTDRWLRSLKRKGGDAYRRFWNLIYHCNPFVRKAVFCPQLIRIRR
jgi:hypothetical protein